MTFTEEQIRPGQMFESYLELCARDSTHFFDASAFEYKQCPCCGAAPKLIEAPAFTKYGFAYCFCGSCRSLIAYPRPTFAAIQRYYREGESVAYWMSDFYRTTAESRAELIVRPKAALLVEDLRKAGVASERVQVFDIGAGYGLFMKEVADLAPDYSVCAVEPGDHFIKHLRSHGRTVIPKFAEELVLDDLELLERREATRVFVSQELIEHLLEPRLFFARIRSLMRPGDYFSFTTLSASGFDILYLLAESNAVHPPHHLTFFSVPAIRRMLEDLGFRIVRFSTPGELDVDIVRKSAKFCSDSAMQALLSEPQASRELQDFLKKNLRSSHMNVFCTADDANL